MRGLRLDVGGGRQHVAFAVRIAFLIGTCQAHRTIAHAHVIAAHEAVGIERVAVGRITQCEIVGLHARADGLNPPAAHVVRHRGGMMLDLIGGVARQDAGVFQMRLLRTSGKRGRCGCDKHQRARTKLVSLWGA